MDNLTHTLAGAAMADLALPAASSRGRRRLFMAVGVLAANLPDVDLLVTGLSEPPLGYLLHHRGHTHTLLGLVPQALLVALAWRAVPALRRLADGCGARLWALLAAALLSHILLDAGNNYGVHPFHPLDARWYYGDAVFILEPWLWLVLAVPLAWNVERRRGRVALLGAIGLLCGLLGGVGVVPVAVVVGVVAAAGVVGAVTRPLSPAARGAWALAAGTVLIAAQYGLGAVARTRLAAEVARTPRGALLDLVLTPDPGNPVCWSVIVIEKDVGRGDYTLRRGALSLAPGWVRPERCLMRRLLGGSAAEGAIAWDPDVRQPLAALRELSRRDCWARAWMQFGRAPVVHAGSILDYRFENGARDNFTAMRLRGADAGCPPHVTSWAMPRADLLAE